MEFGRSDLTPILSGARGGDLFRRALQRIQTPDQLLRTLGRFVQFNSIFGGCVANLAGEIAVRQELFRDRDEPVECLADRSVEVASEIFFAAVDEFDDRVTAHRDTHRTLAQATLKAAARFYGFANSELNRILAPSPDLARALRNVQAGYAVNQPVDERALLRAVGFHLGSELLADEEFSLLDRYLRERHGELAAHLEQARVEIGGREHAAYFWIRVHTSVEMDHFDHAARGARAALRFFTGEAGAARAWMLEGCARFAQVQAEFMEAMPD